MALLPPPPFVLGVRVFSLTACIQSTGVTNIWLMLNERSPETKTGYDLSARLRMNRLQLW